ncbi:hypothetical protein GC175_08955 [bacterium]|nr:hypothetical protein [bacterium]
MSLNFRPHRPSVSRLLPLWLMLCLLWLPDVALPASAQTLPHWSLRNTGLPPQISVTTLLSVQRSGLPDLLLAGVYAPQSLYVSEDGGVTWAIAGEDGVDGQPLHVLAQHSQKELLAGTVTGLFVSDGVAAVGSPTWARVDAWPDQRAVYAIDHSPAGESLIAGLWPALFVFDGERGRFTTPVVDDPGALLSVLALDNGTILAGSDGAGLFVSEDQGVTWRQVEEIGETFVAALEVAPWDSETVLARTRKGLFRSLDRGQSWQPVLLNAEGRPDTLLPLPESQTWLLGMSTGQLYATVDNGESWSPWGTGLPRDGLFQTLAQVESNGITRLWAGTANGLYHSDDDGQTWTQHPHLGAPLLSALAVAEDGTLYVGSHDGVYRSTDQGAKWAWHGDGLPPRAVEAITFDPHEPGRIFAAVDGGGLWQKRPNDPTWTLLGWQNTAVLYIVADWARPGLLYVRLAFERIYAAEPGSEDTYNWSARWTGMSTITEVMSFAQSPHDADLFFAGGATDLYRSEDGAVTWQRIGAELDGQSVFFLAVDSDDPATVYAGATNGLYISRDLGDSWRRWGTGLENRTVTSLARHPEAAHLLYAGTKHAGIFRSEDGGASWQLDFDAADLSAPLSVDTLHFSPVGDVLYAATDLGLLAQETVSLPDAPIPCIGERCADERSTAPRLPAPRPLSAPRYGMHTVSANAEMLPLVHAAGFDTVVKLFTWWEIEPTRNQFIWQPWDEVVAGAEYYGLNLVIRLDKHPIWATVDPLTPGAPPVDLAEYDRFVRAVVNRYKGRVAGYILWNEPNLALEWSGLPPDPEAYVALLKTGYEAVKAVDPAATVLSAGLAPTNTNNEDAMDDRLFLEAMYRHGAADFFDVLAAHPYGFGRPPDDPRGANGGLNMARLEDLRAIMQDHGDSDTPVWITEMGWTLPGYGHAVGKGVNALQQARYWADALTQIRRDWPWVALVTAWNLGGQNHPDWGGYSLLGRDGRPRLAYSALQRAVLAEQGAPQIPRHPQAESVTVLAGDAVVHLGDAPHLGQPWFPIFRARPISPEWEGIFYLQDPDDAPWTLTLRVMQSNFWANQIWINGEPLPSPIPPDDFSRSWVTVTVPVAAELLQPGPNHMRITVAQSSPLIQAQNFAYDEVQIKEIVLRRE